MNKPISRLKYYYVDSLFFREHKEIIITLLSCTKTQFIEAYMIINNMEFSQLFSFGENIHIRFYNEFIIIDKEGNIYNKDINEIEIYADRNFS